jgi:hypothetical protein
VRVGTESKQARDKEGGQIVDIEIPRTLAAGHEHLHAELAKAVEVGGNTGEAARVVAELMQVHARREAEHALRLLGLLPLLAAMQVSPEMEEAVALTERLKADLPTMLEEHDAIVGALERLAVAAQRENRPEYARFAQQLKMHARAEEEVLYPAALLVGEYVKLRLRGQ